MIIILICLAGGLALSALFSGAETGFYRIPRLRLVLDALQGDHIAKGLLWFTRHPTFFVATVLTGNNLANYIISASIVALVYYVLVGPNELVAILASSVATPLVFVYAELLPKTVFLHRPDRLLRPVSPLFFAFGALFLPLTFPLWILGRVLAWLAGESSERWETSLARRELKRILGEAKAAGVLRPVQYRLAEAVFELGTVPITQFAVPPESVPAVDEGISLEEALATAAKRKAPELLLWQSGSQRAAGYVRTIDLLLRGSKALGQPRPLLNLPAAHSALEALVHLVQADEPWAQVEESGRRVIGLVSRQKLVGLILSRPVENQPAL
ncbi:MAG: CNNM domain-containing protein [Thermoguttaceae bacterium]|nr:CNNM domain-containing protein [Thermoguttaceae bacterium]MDW8078068.1 CNNM domain-containing protein [Thermoguttaceae bacterium]